MTSLRGWYITGHDIQQEYKVFQLTKDNAELGHLAFQDAYNACMSITILPTMFSQMLLITPPYVFKVVYQLMFALCPVIVFLLARASPPSSPSSRRSTSSAFPTYFTDMPFLNRQEMAYLFVGIGFLVATQPRWSTRRARTWFAVITTGVLLSHYSTNYVFIATIGLGFFGGIGIDLARRVWGRVRGVHVSFAPRRRSSASPTSRCSRRSASSGRARSRIPPATSTRRSSRA